MSNSPRTKSPSLAQHLDYLDGVRALAALMVVAHHIYQLSQYNGPMQGLPALLTRPLGYGHFAVSVFIVISGFCLMLPIAGGDGSLRGGALLFFRKRARRILPSYYLAMVVALVMRFLPSANGEAPACLAGAVKLWNSTTTQDVVTHFLLIHNFFPSSFEKINQVFWSIAVEWQIYFIFPLLVLAWKRVGGALVTISMVVVTYGVLFALHNSPLVGITPHYWGLFTVGMAACSAAFSKEEAWVRWSRRVPWALLGTVIALATVVACYRAAVVPLRTMDLPIALSAASYLIAASVSDGSLVRRFLSVRPLVSVGKFAYSLYLVHLPAIWITAELFATRFDRDSNTLFYGLLAIGLPFSVLFSYGFYLIGERPFVRSAARARAVTLPAPEFEG